MKKIVIGIVIIIGILFIGYLIKKDSLASPVAPLQNDPSTIKATPTPMPEIPKIDGTSDLYLETQKLIPEDYSKEYTELKNKANSF